MQSLPVFDLIALRTLLACLGTAFVLDAVIGPERQSRRRAAAQSPFGIGCA